MFRFFRGSPGPVAAWLLILLACRVLSVPALAASCAFDGEPCNATESWVHQHIASGQEADLDLLRHQTGAEAEPIRPRFLRALLLHALGDGPPALGNIRIRGALFCEPASAAARCDPHDGETARRGDPASGARREGFRPLDLRDLTVTVAIDLARNRFRGDLALGGAKFEQVLNLDETTILGDIDANRVNAMAGLTMFKAFVAGRFDADGLRSGSSVNLFHTTVLDRLHMRGARITDDLDLGGVWLTAPPGGSGREPEKEQRNTVGLPRRWLDLSNAEIGKQLMLTGARIPAEGADLSGAKVGGSVWIEADSQFMGGLTMERAQIADSLMLGQARFAQLDLTAAHIEREIRLEGGGKPTLWAESPDGSDPPWLILRNAKVGAIRDTTHSWPDCVTLAGFVYDQPPHNYAADLIGKLSGSPYRACVKSEDGGKTVFRGHAIEPSAAAGVCDNDLLSPWATCTSRGRGEPDETRGAAWWLNWIERDPNRSAQNYDQLATALRNFGDERGADAVLLARRIMERRDLGPWSPRSWFSVVEQYLVGFGIGAYGMIAGLWLAVAVGIAAWRLHVRLRHLETLGCDTEGKGMLWTAAASLLATLPLVPMPRMIADFLNKPLMEDRPETEPLRGWLAFGFSCLGLLGLLVGGFLLHGFTRLTGL